MRRFLLCLTVLLTGCADDQEAPEPLAAIYIFEQFFRHTMEATTADGARYLFRFERGDFAERIGTTADYVRWYTDPEQGLCLQEYGADVVCGPVYQVNVAHYRWRDLLFSDLTVREPGLGRAPLR
jgi:hypothetical protein